MGETTRPLQLVSIGEGRVHHCVLNKLTYGVECVYLQARVYKSSPHTCRCICGALRHMMSSILHDFPGLSVSLYVYMEPSEAKAYMCVCLWSVFCIYTYTSVSDSVWMEGKSNGSLRDRTKLNSVIQEFMLNLH